MSGIVVDLFGVHGPDDADVVGNSADIRKGSADGLAGASGAGEWELRGETGQFLALELGDLLAFGE